MKSSRSETALPQDLQEALARARDRLGVVGARCIYFTSIGSTNDVAIALAADPGAEGSVVVADAQTAGRGRRGRSWFSPPASGLYVSLVLAPARAREQPRRATTLLTLAAGVALAEGIERAIGLAPSIKWPNDLVVGGRKIAGILAEAVHESVVLGYGVNIGPMAYPPELRERATSLETELGRAIDRAAVFGETLAAIAARYRDLLEGRFDAILDRWRSRAPAHRGARVAWQTENGTAHGITDGIDQSGALLVRTADRVERIVGGEVVWL